MAELEKTIIVVNSTYVDEKGYLVVQDKDGQITKVRPKLSSGFPMFEKDKAIELTWDTYQGNRYVKEAKLIQQDASTNRIVASSEVEKLKIEPQKTQCKSFALSYSKDLAVAGRIEVIEIIPFADKFLEWLNK